VGTKLVESRDLHHLAQISVGLGEFEKAKAYLAASFRISWSLAAKELIADALETAAAVLNRDKNFSLAAVLSGAAERVRQESGCRMPPNEEERYSQEVSALTRALGKFDAGALMERGRAMKTAEAVETALAALSPRLSSPSTTAANGSAKA
jgi:hypothetical protein